MEHGPGSKLLLLDAAQGKYCSQMQALGRKTVRVNDCRGYSMRQLYVITLLATSKTQQLTGVQNLGKKTCVAKFKRRYLLGAGAQVLLSSTHS